MISVSWKYMQWLHYKICAPICMKVSSSWPPCKILDGDRCIETFRPPPNHPPLPTPHPSPPSSPLPSPLRCESKKLGHSHILSNRSIWATHVRGHRSHFILALAALSLHKSLVEIFLWQSLKLGPLKNGEKLSRRKWATQSQDTTVISYFRLSKNLHTVVILRSNYS